MSSIANKQYVWFVHCEFSCTSLEIMFSFISKDPFIFYVGVCVRVLYEYLRILGENFIATFIIVHSFQ